MVTPPEENLICLAILGVRLDINPTTAAVIERLKSLNVNVRLVSNDHADAVMVFNYLLYSYFNGRMFPLELIFWAMPVY